jgi:hypothetical protein
MVTVRRARPMGLPAVAIVVALVAAGCAPARVTPSPIIIVVTLPPAQTSAPAPSPSATPSPPLSASPTATPSPTPPPAATTVPASTCTVRGAGDPLFWSEAAATMTWDVYCPVLPSEWFVSSGSYDASGGGSVAMAWKGPSNGKLQIQEGAFCTTDAATCSPHSSVVGPADFGDLPGQLDTLADGSFAIYVNPGTARAYTLTGSGVNQATFVALAAALVKVAKS